MAKTSKAIHYWTSDEGLERIRNWAEEGLNDRQIFSMMGISHATYYKWIKDFPVLASTIKEARKQYKISLEDTLYKQACGENFTEEVKTVMTGITTDFRSLTLLFLPEDLQKFKSAIEQVSQYMLLEEDIFAARLKDLEKLNQAQNVVKASYKIESAAKALTIILDIFNRHLDDLSKGYTDNNGELKYLNNVPLVSVFGNDSIPSDLAVKLNKAINKAISKGKIEENNKVEILRILLERRKAGE